VHAEHGATSVVSIALAYVLRKAALLGVHSVFPVVGGRKTEQLHDNIAALGIWLTEDQVAYLESVRAFEVGYPGSSIGDDPNATGVVGIMSSNSAYLAFPGATKK
jgi:diketogulonate reductase-like aldo/keto reductase